MSGAAGGGRIPRSAVEQTVKDYSEKILSRIEGFKNAKLSGSFNRPDKEDFGDIDIIVTIETGEDKKTVKQKIATLFQSLPDSELPPLQNPKYKGKKFINHGEMVSNLYPISGMPGEFVQVDNIISLSAEEGEFKKTILDYPAELQGLILGLVKVPLLEEDSKAVFSRLGIKDIPEAKQDQEYEFHIDTAGLTLRLVTYGGNYKILDSNIVWQSRSFDHVRTLLKDFNLDGTFEDLMQQLQGLKNERSKNRVKGYFAKSIKVGAAEQGTPKGDSKQKALDAVSMLEENRRILARAKLMTQFLDEDAKPRIAVFPGAFKPPHRDHVGRILAAVNKVGEEGKVLVLISPLDRVKEGEEPISAKQSLAVFELYREKGILPLNVTFRVSEMNSPIGAAYKEFESDPTQPYIAVFGKDDASRYRNIEDKLPNVTPDSFEEANVGDISASDLRKAIADRDKEVITRYLPTGVTADEYLSTLGIDKLLDEADTDAAAALWEPHATMLAKMKKEPELLKGLWKSLSKPSRRALVLYFRKQKAQNENAIPKSDEKAAPYGSGYKPVVEEAATVSEIQGKKLRVFDFDDTLVHVDATIYITHKDGSKEGLTPAEYAVYDPQPGDTFNFKEFSSVIKKAKPLEDNIQDLIKSYNDPTEKTTILTARLLGYPVKKYLRDEFNIEPYVIGLGSSDPQDKAKWIESQINKGYTDIEFRDDSAKNVDAVAALQDKHPGVRLVSTLVAEGIDDPMNPGILKKRLGTLSCTKVKAEKAKLKDKGTTYAKALQRYLNYHCNPKESIAEELASSDKIDYYLNYYTNVSPSTFSLERLEDKIVIQGFTKKDKQTPPATLDIVKAALLENASYSSDIDYKGKILELTKHMLRKGMNIKPLPAVKFINGDSDNARQFLGKTAYYDPNNKTIVLYTEGRHPKDIVRSFAHEMVHHTQNLENRLGDVSTTNTMEDDNIDKLEQEANLKGTMTFRNWTDSLNESTTTDNYPFKVTDKTYDDEDNSLITVSYELTTPDNSYRVEFYSGEHSPEAKTFDLSFGVNTGDLSTIDTFQMTGEGNARKIFKTILNIVEDFINKEDVEKIVVDGTDEKRKRIYKAIFSSTPPNISDKIELKEANLTDSLNEDIFQKSLDQTEKEALEITYKNWDTFGGKECNNGFCDIFAKNLAKHLPGSKILSTEDPRNETLGHVWVEYQGKYFDAETPDGVPSWKDLPWMKEFYSKVGSYPTDIETLNELVTDTVVVCNNCGWEWEMENGGKDLYTCHKCGHDNTPLQEKKNKDPFGLNQYARELAQGLEETIVMEGRYDTISNQISSEIFNNWKAQFDKNNTREEALFTKSYDLENAAGRPVVFDLAASLTFKETEEGTYSVNGDADEGDEEVYDADGELEDEGLDGSISMYFQVDPRELPRLWSKISMDLKDIVRHEIEHLTQAGYNVVDSKRLPDDRMLRMYIQDLKTMPERDYYLLDKEIPAMLQGMYFKAKKMKEPFAKVVNDYLTIQKVSDEDREIILNRWRPAAKTLNLPNL